MERRSLEFHKKGFIAVVLLILLGELSLTVQPLFVASNQVTLTSEFGTGGTLKVTYDFKQGSYPNTIRVAVFPTFDALFDRDIFVYCDQDYPSSLVSLSGWLGIIDHLEENQRLKGYRGKLETVNALRLRDVMLQRNDSVVIIPSGVLPETVHTKESSLVRQFMENGGIMIWVGDVFAYYSGKPRGQLQPSSSENPGLEAQEEILGFVLSNTTELNLATEKTMVSNGLSLKYTGLQAGIYVDEVLRHDGLVLGKTSGNMTSLATVPVGNGFLVVFSGKVSPARSELGEDFVASDIMTILLSGIIYSNGQFAYNVIDRTDVHSQSLILDVTDERIRGAVFLAVSDDYYSYYFYRQFIPRP